MSGGPGATGKDAGRPVDDGNPPECDMDEAVAVLSRVARRLDLLGCVDMADQVRGCAKAIRRFREGLDLLGKEMGEARDRNG